MLKTKHDVILNFIEQFRELGAENCFSNGMCYYFTVILRTRFGGYSTKRLYDPVANHFATQIDGRIYDITGDITDEPDHKWIEWMAYQRIDSTHARRIERDCITKVPSDVHICQYCSDLFCGDRAFNQPCTKPNGIHKEV